MNTNTKKTFCSNCGEELTGNFCANCGTLSGANTQAHHQELCGHKVHENAVVKARYNPFAQIVAGIYGPVMLLGAVVFLFYMIADLTKLSFGEFAGFLFAIGLFAGFSFLTLLPGILMIRKRTPKEELRKTYISFIVKTLLFNAAWIISLFFCCFIIGLLMDAWKIGWSVTKCRDNEYTVFVGDEKIAVTRMEDPEFSTLDQKRYIYVDENGEFYRPSLS